MHSHRSARYLVHFGIYLLLMLFCSALYVFSHNAVDLGWGFFPMIVCLPFVPFILVWLAIQFSHHLHCIRSYHQYQPHLLHCIFTATLLLLFVLLFIY
ncbi:hypothetical protein FLM48_09120 [Shewanella sp. Scap07]|nr:hypothetical protein FLM48_09120 [Shewanella sp. Scap07]